MPVAKETLFRVTASKGSDNPSLSNCWVNFENPTSRHRRVFYKFCFNRYYYYYILILRQIRNIIIYIINFFQNPFAFLIRFRFIRHEIIGDV